METFKEEVRYIPDTPVQIYHDADITPARGILPPHWHEELELNFAVRGEVVYTVGGASFPLSQGEVLVVDRGLIHSGRCVSAAEILTIQINRNVMEYSGYRIPAFRTHIPAAQSRELRAIMSDILRIYEDRSPYYEMRINSRCLDLCYCLLTRCCGDSGSIAAADPVSGEIKRAIGYIEEHCREKLKLEDVADLLGYNPSYFSRLFHQQTGFSFVEYLNHCRAQQAAVRLEDSQQSVSDIAYECGFPNVSSFFTFFKREYGTTPEKYRKETRNEK